ncbi:MAG: hypothetical protein Ct9H90mP7_1280 [Candidatus Neomarinimicrobiota bacterium]|nr:MAG: hypothetical protein Ct9H90mP7_1280 [Candidatus Neomarinimicrobiota bacterium]
MVIVSYQYNAGGAVLHTILQDDSGTSLISVETGTIIAAIFIILYTMLAGLVSVAYTDVANGIIFISSFIIAIPIFFFEAGGFEGRAQFICSMDKNTHMNFFGVYSLMDIINFCCLRFYSLWVMQICIKDFLLAKMQRGQNQLRRF